ncbi:hypothetical protein DZC31_31400 (plasmid) [Stenotrophomonas rhizophila]|nr:hypothetical protein DZC31_31400 [Stenotrophomonas rhizophila]
MSRGFLTNQAGDTSQCGSVAREEDLVLAQMCKQQVQAITYTFLPDLPEGLVRCRLRLQGRDVGLQNCSNLPSIERLFFSADSQIAS